MSRVLVVLSTRMGPVLPAAALPALRAAEQVGADHTVPEQWLTQLGARRTEEYPSGVLFTTDPAHPMRADADEVIETEQPPGAVLLDAVAVMDRLRSPGGCPWDAEQTHTSLLQYLVEECYELHQAVEDADRPALREELGDVLLQVLFHARLAVEGGVKPFGPDSAPFGINEVAADLVHKLVSRHPHVFDADGAAVLDASEQELRWDELKRVEKQRDSALDGVALGQPAVALVAKLVSRARKAGLPVELARLGAPGARRLFEAVAEAKLAGRDPEQELRDSARAFDQAVRAAERAARAAGLDPHRLSEADWNRLWGD